MNEIVKDNIVINDKSISKELKNNNTSGLTNKTNTISHNVSHSHDHSIQSNITEKKEESDDELFGSDYYYFEIDWRPTEIIWRIGAEPNKM